MSDSIEIQAPRVYVFMEDAEFLGRVDKYLSPLPPRLRQIWRAYFTTPQAPQCDRPEREHISRTELSTPGEDSRGEFRA